MIVQTAVQDKNRIFLEKVREEAALKYSERRVIVQAAVHDKNRNSKSGGCTEIQ